MKTIFSVNEAGYTESVSVFSSENEVEARAYFQAYRRLINCAWNIKKIETMKKFLLTAIICLLVYSCSTCSRTFKNESILDYYGQCIDNLDTDVNRNMFDVSRDLVKEVEEDRRLCKSDRDMVIGWIFERLENLNEPWEPLYLHVGRLIRKKTPVSMSEYTKYAATGR